MKQVSIINENYLSIQIINVLTIKLSAWLITILSIAITKSIQAEVYATPSTCFIEHPMIYTFD